MFDPPNYIDLTPKERQEKYSQFFSEWEIFLTQEGVHAEIGKDYYIHKKNLFEIIRRCDKRRVYMAMFHDLKDVCEYKHLNISTSIVNSYHY